MDAIRRCLNSANALNIFSGASSRTTSAQSYAESQSVPRRHFAFRFFDFFRMNYDVMDGSYVELSHVRSF
jgi:hypothetical protein